MLRFETVPAEAIPPSLLLHADPSQESIDSYLPGSRCFGATDADEIVGVCVTNTNSRGLSEIFNIAVTPERQQQGIGTQLLAFAIRELRHAGAAAIEVGTGTFGYQLLFYQRAGFRVDAVWKNHFVDNYKEPIYEFGVHLQDMLRLRLEL